MADNSISNIIDQALKNTVSMLSKKKWHLLGLVVYIKGTVIYGQEISSRCLDGELMQYIIDPEQLETFDQAQSSCEQKYTESVLAQIPNETSFNTLTDLLVSLHTLPNPLDTVLNPYIGLRRPLAGESGTDPSSYFLDNSGGFGDVEKGSFPWHPAEPNGFNGSGCVQ